MKVSRWVVPVLIVLLIAVGLFGADTFAIPSLTINFAEDKKTAAESIRTVVFVVDGVKCVDTARSASSTLEEIPGVIRYVAYASRNRVEITYDATRTGVESLREAIEGPVYDEASREFLFHVFKILEIDTLELGR
jgi:copper chaperone CopZ